MVLDFSILHLFLRNINFATTRLYEWNSSRRCTEVFETLKKSSYNYIHYINVISLTVTYMKITSYFVLQQYNGYVGKLLFYFDDSHYPTDGRICALCVKFRYNVRTEIADNMGGLWAGVHSTVLYSYLVLGNL